MALEHVVNTAGETANNFIGDPTILVIGIVLIIAAVLIFTLLKKIIVNSILGLIVFGIIHFVIGIQLPFIPTLIVTAIFGLAGIGVMLVMHFLGFLAV
ncbi:MAG: hypothetical protein COT90_05150 [Candidatus Diapherotrites archaeon CG10_big_fil_rev_8_21_14_0_10_31_34]|nr:MAG: hypothetical protein COT90_05150 [Candidatus Diapherotrites archaeon CG10_big_fil_rev_8_21_14_0_10_31_34]